MARSVHAVNVIFSQAMLSLVDHAGIRVGDCHPRRLVRAGE